MTIMKMKKKRDLDEWKEASVTVGNKGTELQTTKCVSRPATYRKVCLEEKCLSKLTIFSVYNVADENINPLNLFQY
jgi:hypothetical protein